MNKFFKFCILLILIFCVNFNKKLPVEKWLEMMGKTKHLLKYPDILGAFQKEVDRRWTRLKAMHESPVL